MFKDELLNKSLNKAIGGGISGSLAMGTQVLSLMWLRTTMNYQYRYGYNTTTAIKILYKDGGIARFYRGILPALIMFGPQVLPIFILVGAQCPSPPLIFEPLPRRVSTCGGCTC